MTPISIQVYLEEMEAGMEGVETLVEVFSEEETAEEDCLAEVMVGEEMGAEEAVMEAEAVEVVVAVVGSDIVRG